MFCVVVAAIAIIKYSKQKQAEGYSIEGENRKRNAKWQQERIEREKAAQEAEKWSEKYLQKRINKIDYF